MKISKVQKEAIKEFYLSIKKLKEHKIVRSKVIFGDIGEFLATCVFENLILEIDRTTEGHDALDGNEKVQIKFSDSSDAKNIDVGNPSKYDYLIVVLTKDSIHIYNDEDSENTYDYYFYKFTRNEVIKFETRNGSNSFKLSKTKHTKKAIQKLNLEDF